MHMHAILTASATASTLAHALRTNKNSNCLCVGKKDTEKAESINTQILSSEKKNYRARPEKLKSCKCALVWVCARFPLALTAAPVSMRARVPQISSPIALLTLIALACLSPTIALYHLLMLIASSKIKMYLLLHIRCSERIYVRACTHFVNFSPIRALKYYIFSFFFANHLTFQLNSGVNF